MLSELMDFLSERGIEFKTDVPMSKYTTFRIGGNADIMIFPRTVQDVSLIVAELKRENIRRITVGNGSNLLVDDDGIRGAVIKTSLIDFVSVNGCEITAGAGCLNSKVANAALDASLSGMEFAHGIPGSIGGAVFMNAGAYSGTFADIVAETVYVDADGNIRSVKGEEHDFGYRHSCFTPDDVICETKLVLRRGNKDEIRAEMQNLIEKRKASQPLEYPSAGSFFKRPTGYFAGKLIQDSGLKGVSVGGARVSEKHAGFIINTGDATCRDVDGLRELVQKTVYEKFGVMLEPEVKRIK